MYETLVMMAKPSTLANRSIAERVFQALLGASGGTIGGDLSYDGYAMAHANHRNNLS